MPEPSARYQQQNKFCATASIVTLGRLYYRGFKNYLYYLGVPGYNYSMMGPKTQSIVIIKVPIVPIVWAKTFRGDLDSLGV